MDNTDSLETICTEQERELNSKIHTLAGFQNFSGIGDQAKWQDVEKALGSDEAAIEFISFHPLNVKNTSDTIVL